MNYQVEWKTMIIQPHITPDLEVTGKLILETDSLLDAARIAEEELVDGDFFHPGSRYSYSDRRVLAGSVTIGRVTGASLGEVDPDDVLIGDEWTFDHISILKVAVDS